MGDERREGQGGDGRDNPQDEREGGYGAPAEREEEMKREAPRQDEESGGGKDRKDRS